MKHTLTEIVKNQATFSYYRDGNLYYTICIFEEKKFYRFLFPIDITNTEDIGNATFEQNYTKALPLMRYIRKAIDNNTMVVTEHGYD